MVCSAENNSPTEFMEFLYDDTGSITGFSYEGKTYFYVKNPQGDITNIVDLNGVNLINYYYYSYGESAFDIDESAYDYGYTRDDMDTVLSNPITYRGYYRDEETAFYYLQSRYYIPSGGRFLNADIPLYAQSQKDEFAGINLFVYCRNNPVNFSDPTGFKYVSEVGKQVAKIIVAILEIGGLIQQIEINCKPLYEKIKKLVDKSPEIMAEVFLGVASLINVAWVSFIDNSKDAAADYARSVYDAAEGSSLGTIGGILNLIIDAFDKSDDDFYTDDQKSMFIFLDEISVILPELIEADPKLGLVIGVIFAAIYNVMKAVFNYQNGDIFHV